MADEKEKLDIEDIKDPDEELDLDEVVSEKEAVVEEPEPESELETGTEKTEEKAEEQPKPEKPKTRNKHLKFILIGATALLVLVAGVLGAMYFLQKDDSEVADATEEVVTEEENVQEDQEEPETTENLYISSEVGLNLRELPDTKAKVLVIIPFGTKIEVIEKQTGWVKTTYDSKTGWVSADFTQATDPLVYENETYGFGFTFKASWAGYKFFEASNTGSTTIKTYYVAVPTSDKNWDETSSGITKGYASLFVMGVYTKAEWAKLEGGEMLPAKLGESDKYVYTYLPGQAHASDLATQYAEVKDIIKTFETLK